MPNIPLTHNQAAAETELLNYLRKSLRNPNSSNQTEQIFNKREYLAAHLILQLPDGTYVTIPPRDQTGNLNDDPKNAENYKRALACFQNHEPIHVFTGNANTFRESVNSGMTDEYAFPSANPQNKGTLLWKGQRWDYVRNYGQNLSINELEVLDTLSDIQASNDDVMETQKKMIQYLNHHAMLDRQKSPFDKLNDKTDTPKFEKHVKDFRKEYNTAISDMTTAALRNSQKTSLADMQRLAHTLARINTLNYVKIALDVKQQEGQSLHNARIQALIPNFKDQARALFASLSSLNTNTLFRSDQFTNMLHGLDDVMKLPPNAGAESWNSKLKELQNLATKYMAAKDKGSATPVPRSSATGQARYNLAYLIQSFAATASNAVKHLTIQEEVRQNIRLAPPTSKNMAERVAQNYLLKQAEREGEDPLNARTQSKINAKLSDYKENGMIDLLGEAIGKTAGWQNLSNPEEALMGLVDDCRMVHKVEVFANHFRSNLERKVKMAEEFKQISLDSLLKIREVKDSQNGVFEYRNTKYNIDIYFTPLKVQNEAVKKMLNDRLDQATQLAVDLRKELDKASIATDQHAISESQVENVSQTQPEEPPKQTEQPKPVQAVVPENVQEHQAHQAEPEQTKSADPVVQQKVPEQTQPVENAVQQKVPEQTQPVENAVQQKVPEQTQPVENVVQKNTNEQPKTEDHAAQERAKEQTTPTDNAVQQKGPEQTHPVDHAVPENAKEQTAPADDSAQMPDAKKVALETSQNMLIKIFKKSNMSVDRLKKNVHEKLAQYNQKGNVIDTLAQALKCHQNYWENGKAAEEMRNELFLDCRNVVSLEKCAKIFEQCLKKDKNFQNPTTKRLYEFLCKVGYANSNNTLTEDITIKDEKEKPLYIFSPLKTNNKQVRDMLLQRVKVATKHALEIYAARETSATNDNPVQEQQGPVK